MLSKHLTFLGGSVKVGCVMPLSTWHQACFHATEHLSQRVAAPPPGISLDRKSQNSCASVNFLFICNGACLWWVGRILRVQPIMRETSAWFGIRTAPSAKLPFWCSHIMGPMELIDAYGYASWRVHISFYCASRAARYWLWCSQLLCWSCPRNSLSNKLKGNGQIILWLSFSCFWHSTVRI